MLIYLSVVLWNLSHPRDRKLSLSDTITTNTFHGLETSTFFSSLDKRPSHSTLHITKRPKSPEFQSHSLDTFIRLITSQQLRLSRHSRFFALADNPFPDRQAD